MKKLLLPFIFLITPLLWSQNIKLSFDNEIGVMSGYIYEYVYEYMQMADGSNSHLLSKLEWDFKNVFYIGEKINFDTTKNFHLDLQAKVGILGLYGTMQDYDWMDIYYPDNLTNYSIHDNCLKDYTLLAVNTGYNIKLPLQTTFTPSVNFSLESITFTGIGGSYHYQKTDSHNNYINKWDDGSFSKDSEVIQYQQNNISCKFGFMLINTLIPYVNISFSFFAAPFFSLDCIDTHFLKNTMFWDALQNGTLYEGQAKVGVTLKKGTLYFAVGTQYIPKMKGATHSKSIYNNSWGTDSGYGASDRSIWSYSLVYSITL